MVNKILNMPYDTHMMQINSKHLKCLNMHFETLFNSISNFRVRRTIKCHQTLRQAIMRERSFWSKDITIEHNSLAQLENLQFRSPQISYMEEIVSKQYV